MSLILNFFGSLLFFFFFVGVWNFNGFVVCSL